ncbi:MAG TPA: hypothetical protein VIM06_03000 [Rhodanobacter sp.]
MGFMSGPWQKEHILSRLRLNRASGSKSRHSGLRRNDERGDRY